MLSSPVSKATRLALLPTFSSQYSAAYAPRKQGPGPVRPSTSRRGAHAVAVNPTTNFFTSCPPGASQRTKPVGFDEEPCTLSLEDGYGYAKVDIGQWWGPQDEYEIMRKLGWGMYATTWLVYNHTTKKYHAMKIVNEYGTFLETNEAISRAHPQFHELDILHRVSSPLRPTGRGVKQCLRLVDSFYTSRGSAQYLCLVMELGGMDLSSLQSQIGVNYALPPELVKSIVKQLCIALDYMHSECKVVHTDLKPGNILLGLKSREARQLVKTALRDHPPEKYAPRKVMGETFEALKSQPLPLPPFEDTDEMLSWRFKIADYGSAQWLGRRSTNIVQPIRLRAPEVLWGERWDEKIDVWALGCLTYEFLTGTSLFKLDKSLSFSEDIYISRQQLALLTQSGDFPDSDYFNRSSKGDFLKTTADGLTYPKPLAAALRTRRKAPINTPDTTKEERELALAFIARCLTIDPKQRASAKELLRHPWVRGLKAPAPRRKRPSSNVPSTSSAQTLGVSQSADKFNVYSRAFSTI
ncbi:kinase-like domain-containing protein [Ephemerocybe angulata]|uniref:non-specific serine/threonine protein kinase n=1 Tax=Ephemerocybe angulata TaxID=980116 RepID=A0A8H6M704_9AGAR|nr:kinase-like domain-containing protein [Tulosesus angulatus]